MQNAELMLLADRAGMAIDGDFVRQLLSFVVSIGKEEKEPVGQAVPRQTPITRWAQPAAPKTDTARTVQDSGPQAPRSAPVAESTLPAATPPISQSSTLPTNAATKISAPQQLDGRNDDSSGETGTEAMCVVGQNPGEKRKQEHLEDA